MPYVFNGCVPSIQTKLRLCGLHERYLDLDLPRFYLEECSNSAWLAGVINVDPESVAEISRSLYVDDLISGAGNVPKAQGLKENATEIFADAGFDLHKWHSDAPELEGRCIESENDNEITYAKEQLGSSADECKLLGLAWNKREDTLSVTFPEEKCKPTKREVLGKLARVYDPLALVSPMTLQGKMIFREACESKVPWDATLPDKLAKLWDKCNPTYLRVCQPGEVWLHIESLLML